MRNKCALSQSQRTIHVIYREWSTKEGAGNRAVFALFSGAPWSLVRLQSTSLPSHVFKFPVPQRKLNIR